MNNAVNSSTGETPFFLNYGRHPLTPNIQEFGSRLAQVNTPHEGYEHFVTDSPADQIPAVLRYTEHFQKTLEQAKLRLQQAQQRQKAYADRHRRHVEYEEGEQVLLNSRNLKLKHPGSRKLLPRWVGPFTVERHIKPVAYRLALPDSMRIVHPVFHVSRLAGYRTDGRCQPPPPPIELEGELKYEVEKILDKRTRKTGRCNRMEYLIQWRGYDHAHDSWEPVSNLLHCRESIQAYEDSRRLMPDIGRRGSKRRQRNWHFHVICVTDITSLGATGAWWSARRHRRRTWAPWLWATTQRWLARRTRRPRTTRSTTSPTGGSTGGLKGQWLRVEFDVA